MIPLTVMLMPPDSTPRLIDFPTPINSAMPASITGLNLPLSILGTEVEVSPLSFAK